MREGSLSGQTLVFPGRFQPFHNGHDEVVKRVMEVSERQLVLAVVCAIKLDSGSDRFDIESAEHFESSRNPFPPLAVHRMLQELARVRYPERPPQVLLIPRPSRGGNWTAIDQFFPGSRTWVVPDAGENWDERKAEFFAAMGDDVIRVPHDPAVSGRDLRSAMNAGDWEAVARGVPVEILPHLREALERPVETDANRIGRNP